MPAVLRMLVVLGGLLAVTLAGCVPADQQRDLEFRLQKAQTERDSNRQSLSEERAKVAALAEKLKTTDRAKVALEAENGRIKGRLDGLQQRYEEAVALLEKRASAPLARPEVPASPLPPKLDQALQDFATKFKNRVWYERGRGALSFANDQLFDPGSDAVRADAHAALFELASLAARGLPEQFEIVVVGHTDDAPITKPETVALHATNWHLSVHRAIAVRDVLEKAGLPAGRFGVMGYGSQRPISGDRVRNRRVEVFFARKGEVQPLAPVRPAGR